MADSRLNLGGYDLFPFAPNWTTLPESSGELLRRTLQFPGTIAEINSLTDEKPLSFEATFLLSTREDIYNMQDFFDGTLGRIETFWVEHPVAWAILASDAAIYDEKLICLANSAHLGYRGYERLYVRMSNDDITTRHVSS